jgi:hypothetical protein
MSVRGGVRCRVAVGCLVAASFIFHGGAPASASPGVVSLDPSTGLVDGQHVTLSGSGLNPNFAYATVQCTSDLQQCSDERGSIGSDGNGSFAGTVVVRRYVTYADGDGVTQTVDCASAPGKCSVAVYDPSMPGDLTATPPMTFNAPK